MTEVEATLRFVTHSLGNCRCGQVNRFPHDPDGRVMFMPTWWASLVRYAAKVLSKHHHAVKEIDWDPFVVGAPLEYRRYYAKSRYQRHEAFYPGDSIVVRAVLPDDLDIDDFRELLVLAGRYRGVSPYGNDKQLGRYVVVDVRHRRRASAQKATRRLGAGGP